MKTTISFLFIAFVLVANAQEYKLVKSYGTEDARQGVAVDENSMYVISNQSISKRDKATGELIKTYQSSILKHLNSGVVYGDKLYCAHSNYSEIPMTSSIEIWNTKNLKHIGSHSFGIDYGSCTWMVRYQDFIYVMFVQYAKEGKRQKNRDVSWSQLVKFDNDWRKIEAWVLPPKLIQHLTPYGLSGGLITTDGKILCTHHDHQEIYVLNFPKMGSELIWESTTKTPIKGQAICEDPANDKIIWGIDKKEKKVLKTKLR